MVNIFLLHIQYHLIIIVYLIICPDHERSDKFLRKPRALGYRVLFLEFRQIAFGKADLFAGVERWSLDHEPYVHVLGGCCAIALFSHEDEKMCAVG